MKEDVAKKWVAALRSGKFKQARCTLQRGDAYCCLGVLCKVAEEDGVELWKEDGKIAGGVLTMQKDVVVWAGTYGNKPVDNTSLIELNDKEHKPFSQIADFIETHWERL